MNLTFVAQMERANGFLCKGHQEIISLKRCFLISERRDFKGVVLVDSKRLPFQSTDYGISFCKEGKFCHLFECHIQRDNGFSMCFEF